MTQAIITTLAALCAWHYAAYALLCSMGRWWALPALGCGLAAGMALTIIALVMWLGVLIDDDDDDEKLRAELKERMMRDARRWH